MERFSIDKFRCARCGQCAAVCPSRLIEQPSLEHFPSMVDDAEERCISCNHCVAVCPVQAFSVDGVNGNMYEPIIKDMVPRYDGITTLIQMRRSIRCYTDKSVDDKLVDQLIHVARYAPSAKNGLPVKWLVVNGRKKILELEELVIKWFATIKGMESLVEAWKTGAEPIFRGAPCLVAAYTDNTAIWPVVDATIAVETLDLCMAAKRMGACWAGFFIQAAQKDVAIQSWLGLAKNETLQGALMFGYIGSEENYQRFPQRPEPSIRWIREKE